MIKPIVKDEHLLAQKATPASQADLPLATDLIDTLVANQDKCVGMAANMIGISKNIIIARIGPLNLVMFNPQIIAKSDPYHVKEGCLSLTGYRSTTRYKKITVQFYDQHWQKRTLPLTDFPAEIVQHEIDHCNGIII